MSFFGFKDFKLEIAKKTVPGHGHIRKFGLNTDIDTGGFETIWDGGGTYAFPTVTESHDIASSSANDVGTTVTSGTATGGSALLLQDSGATFIADGVVAGDSVLNDTKIAIARVIAVNSEIELSVFMISPSDGLADSTLINENGDTYRIVRPASTGISYLHMIGNDSNFARQEELVVMNGTTNVPTVNSYSRVSRLRMFNPGSAAGNVGTITATAPTPVTVTAQINPGNNTTLMAVFTTFTGQTSYMDNWWARMSGRKNGDSAVTIKLGRPDSGFYVLENAALMATGSTVFRMDMEVPLPLPGGVDIFIEADASVNDMAIAAGFNIITVDD